MQKQVLVLVILILTGCQPSCSTVIRENWGLVQGKKVYHYILKNKAGMEVKITNFGGTVTSISCPDKYGNWDDVVLGFDNLEQYKGKHPCFGATIGRFANRIRNGRFEIGDRMYQLEQNSGEHCLHGGNEFDRVVWEAETLQDGDMNGITMSYLSKDGEKGFPGNLKAKVTLILREDNALEIRFEAETDKATHVNMTNNSYFNLNGMNGTVHDHQIRITALEYTEIDEDIIPTGTISSLEGKAWNLNKMTRLGENIGELDHNGYHYNYVLDKPKG